MFNQNISVNMNRINEEVLVLSEFNKNLKYEVSLFNKVINMLEKIISSHISGEGEYNKYAVLMLAGLNYKGFLSAFDRISKGYLSDSEAVLKKTIESFLSQACFYSNNENAKLWFEGKIELGRLEKNRYELSKKLDVLNKVDQFFPTDMDNFFEYYVYGVFYKNSNTIAHLDFDKVYREMGLEDNPEKYSSVMVLGPKLDVDYMETTLKRIIMFTMFQSSLIRGIFKDTKTEDFDELFKEIFNYFSPK